VKNFNPGKETDALEETVNAKKRQKSREQLTGCVHTYD
jgi:hypothetical protein